jgi:hypothetical protein
MNDSIIKVNNECISCLEQIDSNEKSIYLLPCLHQICSQCTDDISKYAKLNNSKYTCLECYEQFDLKAIKTIIYSNEYLKIGQNVSAAEKLINKKVLNDIIPRTINLINKLINEIHNVLTSLKEYKIKIEKNYEKILDDLKNLNLFYDDLINELNKKANILFKFDLKTIDLEIESIENLLERYDKYLLTLTMIDFDYFDFNKVTNLLNFIKPTEYFNKKSIVEIRKLDYDFYDIICPSAKLKIFSNDKYFTIPSTITYLSFGDYYNSDPTKWMTNSLTHIALGWNFNQNIKGCIPKSCKYLKFGYDFNQDIRDSIPYGVTHLIFGPNFNQDTRDCIPNSVTHLTLGTQFNHFIKGCIPNSVTHLFIYSNKNIKDCIPHGVTHLSFGSDFNKDITDCIPNSVTHLTFSCDFNQNIKNCIPNSVTHLTLGSHFNQPIKDCIPNSVTHLTFGSRFNLTN